MAPGAGRRSCRCSKRRATACSRPNCPPRARTPPIPRASRSRAGRVSSPMRSRASPQPVTLVGHSRGGIVISRAAELVPEQPAPPRLSRRPIYCPRGGSLAEAARADRESLVPPNMIPAAGRCHLQPRPGGDPRRAVWPLHRRGLRVRAGAHVAGTAETAGEPAEGDRAALRQRAARVRRMPSGPDGDAGRRSGACRRNCPATPVLTLDSDHSPFLSHPEELARLLGGL